MHRRPSARQAVFVIHIFDQFPRRFHLLAKPLRPRGDAPDLFHFFLDVGFFLHPDALKSFFQRFVHGRGEVLARLFGELRRTPVELRQLKVAVSSDVTHLRYRVSRP